MRTATPSLLLFLCASIPALAQPAPIGRLITEVSIDNGQTWGSVRNASPGETVQFRLRMTLTNPPAGLLGAAGAVTLQPTLTNWRFGDSRLPFTNANGVGVDYADSLASLGRINPFASAGMGTGAASGVLTSFVDNGVTLRFAGASAAQASNTWWGVSLGQRPPALSTNFLPGNDAILFKYAIMLSPGIGEHREMLATVPHELMNGSKYLAWYANASGSQTFRYMLRPADIIGATLIVPTPPSLLLWVGLIAFRRRQR